jgi:hypothetical protein
LDEIRVSEAIWEETRKKEDILPASEWEKVTFDEKGNINLRL